MKIILILLALVSSLNGLSQNQSEINQSAYEEYNKYDKKLNELYQTIVSEYKNDTIFIKNLITSQRLWIRFRDAELKMKYPQYPDKIYGSINPTCRAFYLLELTEKRIETLSHWINQTGGYDLCDGSVNSYTSIDSFNATKAYIEENSFIGMKANIKKDHRIFGYEEKSVFSKKMILFSIFTNEVDNNPFNCKYGAYYDVNGMTELKLKYKSTEDDFLKIEVIKDGDIVDTVFMLKKWFILE